MDVQHWGLIYESHRDDFFFSSPLSSPSSLLWSLLSSPVLFSRLSPALSSFSLLCFSVCYLLLSLHSFRSTLISQILEAKKQKLWIVLSCRALQQSVMQQQITNVTTKLMLNCSSIYKEVKIVAKVAILSQLNIFLSNQEILKLSGFFPWKLGHFLQMIFETHFLLIETFSD